MDNKKENVDRKGKVDALVEKVRNRVASVRKVTDMVLNLLGPVLMVGGAAVSLLKRKKKAVAKDVDKDVVKDDVVED